MNNAYTNRTYNDTLTARRDAVREENAAHATAAAAGWSVLMLLLGVSAAAAGGGVAAPRRWEVAPVERSEVITNP